MADISKDQVKTFNTRSVRLNKYLSDCGVCSRREADRLIAAGKVSVNGQTAQLGMQISPSDKVECEGRQVHFENKLILMAFNKPKGIECTTDSTNPDNIVDYINYPQRIFPIGRLDKNSSGLILLTNTGELSDKILRGSNYHEKEYEVHVTRPITADFMEKMAAGVDIGDAITRPCQVIETGKHSFRIILTQGLNRQIRRMCEALGYEVRDLKRIRVMNIHLGGLKPGTWRNVTKQELDVLLSELYKGDK